MRTILVLYSVISILGVYAESFKTQSIDGITVEDRNTGGELESFDMEFNTITVPESQTYVSPDVQRMKEFKFYNNTYAYITIREKFTVQEDGEKVSLRSLWNDDIVPWLIAREEEKDLPFFELEVDKISIKKVAGRTITVTTGLMRETQALCRALAKKTEILACEYLRKKRIFGEKASVDEMSAHKSKVKKQEA